MEQRCRQQLVKMLVFPSQNDSCLRKKWRNILSLGMTIKYAHWPLDLKLKHRKNGSNDAENAKTELTDPELKTDIDVRS
jgi:hypothetical protein